MLRTRSAAIDAWWRGTLVSPKLTPARAALINNVETMLDKLVGRISTE